MSPKKHQKYRRTKTLEIPIVRGSDINKTLAKETGLPLDFVEAVTDGFVKVIYDSVVEGKRVLVKSFGTFLPKEYKARPAYDIKRKKRMIAPASCVPYFRASKVFKVQVQLNVKPKHS